MFHEFCFYLLTVIYIVNISEVEFHEGMGEI